MAPLKHLAREYPIIDSNFQHFCAFHGIFSVEDFLLHDLDVLLGSTERESTSQRLKQVLLFIDGQRPPWMNGMKFLEDAQRNKHMLSSGCEGIDLLLGGIREGQITEVVGPSSSGKTQICLQAAANVSKKHAGGDQSHGRRRGGNRKPALGENWKSIPHVRILLTRDRGSNNCNMAIIRHPSMASGKAVKFMTLD